MAVRGIRFGGEQTNTNIHTPPQALPIPSTDSPLQNDRPIFEKTQWLFLFMRDMQTKIRSIGRKSPPHTPTRLRSWGRRYVPNDRTNYQCVGHGGRRHGDGEGCRGWGGTVGGERRLSDPLIAVSTLHSKSLFTCHA